MPEHDLPTRRFHDGVFDWSKAPPERMRYLFTHMTEFAPHAIVARGADPVRELPPGPAALRREVEALTVESEHGRLSLSELIAHPDAPIDGLLVLKDGRILLEAYPRIRPSQQHLLFSVTKVVASLAVAILEARGAIDIGEPIDRYIDELAGSGWAGVAVRDVLDMASGIDCLEAVPEAETPGHPCYVLDQSFGYRPGGGVPVSTFTHIASLGRRRPPGEAYEYTSVNTVVLGWLVEAVSGVPLPVFVSETIWSRIGAERDAVWLMSAHGATEAGGGLSTTLRDLGRFGLLYAEDDRRVVPEGHVRAIIGNGRPDVFLAGDGVMELPVFPGDPPSFQSWQWDRVWLDGDFYKGGWAGQGLHISPASGLVVAFIGTPDATRFRTWDAGRLTHNLLARTARSLARHLG